MSWVKHFPLPKHFLLPHFQNSMHCHNCSQNSRSLMTKSFCDPHLPNFLPRHPIKFCHLPSKEYLGPTPNGCDLLPLPFANVQCPTSFPVFLHFKRIYEPTKCILMIHTFLLNTCFLAIICLTACITLFRDHPCPFWIYFANVCR